MAGVVINLISFIKMAQPSTSPTFEKKFFCRFDLLPEKSASYHSIRPGQSGSSAPPVPAETGFRFRFGFVQGMMFVSLLMLILAGLYIRYGHLLYDERFRKQTIADAYKALNWVHHKIDLALDQLAHHIERYPVVFWSSTMAGVALLVTICVILCLS